MPKKAELSSDLQKKVYEWLEGSYDEKTKLQIQHLLKSHPEELADSFKGTLAFGTGGVRALMGVGPARLNLYTIGIITQGLAHYLKSQFPGPIQVVIGYDTRIYSKEFAQMAASVLEANGITPLLLDAIRPTPFVSFCVRHLKATAGIMITASHNPKEYNGYKVYWENGGQVTAPHDTGILNEIYKIKGFNEVLQTTSPIKTIGDGLDEAYLSAIKPLFSDRNKAHGSLLKIAYTSFHGTGITLVPKALQALGFSNLHFVKEQIIPDGNFPTLQFPNPEKKEALKLGIDLMREGNCDLLIATDPDADRLGIVCQHQGTPYILSGNQTAALCLYYLIQSNKSQKRTVISTIVTTRLLKKMAIQENLTYEDVLTGFKYIAEKITPDFLFGAEESYGYLIGTHAHDKDAIVMSCLIAEMTLNAKLHNKTLVDLLEEIYRQFGLYLEGQKEILFEAGSDSLVAMARCMEIFRSSPEALGLVTLFEDYKTQIAKDYLTGETHKITLPSSDVLAYHFQDGGTLIIRPSGTEPKIKIYAGVCVNPFTSLSATMPIAEEKLTILLKKAEEALKRCATDSH